MTIIKKAKTALGSISLDRIKYIVIGFWTVFILLFVLTSWLFVPEFEHDMNSTAVEYVHSIATEFPIVTSMFWLFFIATIEFIFLRVVSEPTINNESGIKYDTILAILIIKFVCSFITLISILVSAFIAGLIIIAFILLIAVTQAIAALINIGVIMFLVCIAAYLLANILVANKIVTTDTKEKKAKCQ